MVRSILRIALAACVATTAAAQTSTSAKQSGKPASPVSGVLVDRAVSQAFEQGLTIPPSNASRTTVLQVVNAAWHAYPQAHYRVQRSSQLSGPWVTVHDVASTSDSITGLPPQSNLYVRVLALRDGGARGYAVVDSTAPTLARTPMPVAIANLGGIRPAGCTAGSASRFTVAWHPLTGFSKYVVTPYMVPPNQPGSANSLATNPQPAIVVDDTTLTYTMPTTGSMILRVQARVDVPDWPLPGQTFTYLTPMPNLPSSSGWWRITVDAGGSRCG